MRVRYDAASFNTVVPDDVNAQEVFNTLKSTFSELSNGEYQVVTEAGERVMKVTLKTGNKA